MERYLHSISCCWIIILISVSSLAESRLQYSRGSNSANSHTPSWTHINIQPKASMVKQLQNTETGGVRPRSVVVKCHADAMEVVVQADMFDTGLQVDGKHLRLGSDSVPEGGECGAVLLGSTEFNIRANLMDCGTKLSSTQEKIIYSNVLVYSPESSSNGLLRLDGATIPVECHYEKKYAVDSISLHPTWVSYVSRTSADNQIDFNLQIMTDDWKFQRGSYLYFLGDTIHFEVSAIIGNHMPLQVYVDHCVATPTPNTEATIRYDFIENYGCLADAYLTNSSSHFLPRVEEYKLRFQLDAFRFYQESNNQVYITCHVKAVPVSLSVSSKNRACSWIENRWRSVDGNDQACRSCDISYRGEEATTTKLPTIGINAGSAMFSGESLHLKRPEKHQASYIHVHSGMDLSLHNKPQTSSRLTKRGTDNKTGRTMQLGPLIILPSSKYATRPTDSMIEVSAKNKAT